MGRQSNLYYQNNHQYDFLNPENKKNLYLDKKEKQWLEKEVPDYNKENKEQVKNIEKEIKEIKEEIKEYEIE